MQMWTLNQHEALKQRILDQLQTDDNPNSWLQGPKQRYLNDADEPVLERIQHALGEIRKISEERLQMLTEMQKPGWKDECVGKSMLAIGLLDETSMPYVTGI